MQKGNERDCQPSASERVVAVLGTGDVRPEALDGDDPLAASAAAGGRPLQPPTAPVCAPGSRRLVCQLCANKHHKAFATRARTSSSGSNKRREPKEYASFGRLACHVKAAHEGCHVTDAVLAEDLALHRPQTVAEDGTLVVCVKPAGIDTRDFGHIDGMVLLALPEGLGVPRPVHRLDAATAGCLVMARTKEGVVALSKSFKERLVRKQYSAIVCGAFPSELGRSGVLDTPLGGKSCITRFTIVRDDPSFSHGIVTTIKLEPHTGRTHQLRRHMEALGCPIVGDPTYQPGVSQRVRAPGLPPPPLLLWAAKVTLPHPERPEETVEADAGAEPPTFEAYRLAERV